jgi:phage shock protein C
MKQFYKSNDRKISGVCGGIAEYFNIDPTIVRLIWAGLSLFTSGFPGLILYIVCAVVMPERPDDKPPIGNGNGFN